MDMAVTLTLRAAKGLAVLLAGSSYLPGPCLSGLTNGRGERQEIQGRADEPFVGRVRNGVKEEDPHQDLKPSVGQPLHS